MADVSVPIVLAMAVSIASLVTALYAIFRVGFRVDVLWTERDRTAKLEAQVSDLNGYLFHRAEAEARVKHAIHTKDAIR